MTFQEELDKFQSLLGQANSRYANDNVEYWTKGDEYVEQAKLIRRKCQHIHPDIQAEFDKISSRSMFAKA